MRWRKWVKPFISKHGSPEDIAGGFAIGFLIAFTPTIGIQILLSYFIATAFKVSRAAALIPIWITTPVTMTPIYAFTYQIGTWFVDGPSVNHVRRQLTNLVRRMDDYDAFDIPSRFAEAMSISGDIIIPMTIGGLLVGGLCAMASYPLTLWFVRRFRAHRETKRQMRRRRFHFPKLRHGGHEKDQGQDTP